MDGREYAVKKIPLKETDPDLCLKVKVTILLDNAAVFISFCPLEVSVVKYLQPPLCVRGWTREQKPAHFCGKEEKYKSVLPCMNPLNNALNSSSVSYLSVYLSTQMYVKILFPFRQALSITMFARGWGLLMDFSTTCELLSQKCNPMATFFLLIILTDLAWNIGFPQWVQKIMSVGCEW